MSAAPIPISQRIAKHDEADDWEEHLVLRVPGNVVGRMEKAAYDVPGAEELEIDISEDNRTVKIRLGNQILPAKILDLPTINEVHKTLDNHTLYKVTNISQIIMCDEAMPAPRKDKKKTEPVAEENKQPKEENESGEGPSTAEVKVKTARQLAREKVKEYQYPHGITPPMKNVKKRRFRKKKQKKTMAVEEIERELKRLLRSDLEATSVRWEIVADDGNQQEEEEEEEVYDGDDGSDMDKDDDKDGSDDDETL
ncbi:CBN-TAF-7.1 protein [Caenorhabditis brenneri]|uniref:CBN-TAF-7.1 protein n=1 Tax=Caenorhabditis brenneri TaxID=135651 RepID=G0MQH8_CAEBE|nr:CBN-TAF-7.1 protein [Caenorhabditis brenneri]